LSASRKTVSNRIKAPPAAKEKLLKKLLFGFSSKRFNGRRERIAAALLLPTPHVNHLETHAKEPFYPGCPTGSPYEDIFDSQWYSEHRHSHENPFPITFHISAAERRRERARSAARIETF